MAEPSEALARRSPLVFHPAVLREQSLAPRKLLIRSVLHLTPPRMKSPGLRAPATLPPTARAFLRDNALVPIECHQQEQHQRLKARQHQLQRQDSTVVSSDFATFQASRCVSRIGAFLNRRPSALKFLS